MKKQVFKRKKLGVALIMTLMVSIVAVAIASSYIGMTASSAKVARSYAKEAVALSAAQSGIDMVLNAMGNPRNWSRSLDGSYNIFKNQENDLISLPFNVEDFTSQTGGAIPNHLNLVLTPLANPDNIYGGFFGGFLRNNGEGVSIFRTNEAFPVEFGADRQPSKFAHLIVVVAPEALNLTPEIDGIRLSTGNINYEIGVTSIIKDINAPLEDSFEAILENMVASRTIKIRVSSAYPGSVYQNVVASDFPNSPHAEIGDFGYPNWEDLTADAAFLDEHTRFDGGIRVDGATIYNNDFNTATNRWGAPQINRDFNNNNFSNRSLKNDPNLISYKTSNPSADTAGILKFSTLDKAFVGDSSSETYIKNKLQNYNSEGENKYLPEIAKKATVNQRAVYSNLVNGTKVVETQNEWINNVCTSKTTKFEDASDTSNINTIWNVNDKSLLSGITGNSVGNYQAQDGIYKKMMEGKTGYFNYTSTSYKPDPMYANDTMEVPTLRIEITPKNNGSYDEYKISEVTYIADNTKASGWREEVTTKTTLRSDNIHNNMIYVAGANVQVKGEASQSVSIVSDVNPQTEADNANHTGIFDDRLTSPNVWDGSGYKYRDAQLNDVTGVWSLNNNIPYSGSVQNKFISTERTQSNIDNKTYRFPTYGVEEQPSGNITIIGDLTAREGSNPSIGIIAKNRVLLNDMDHNPNKDKDNGFVQANGDIKTPSIETAKTDLGLSAPTLNVLNVDAVIASESHNMCFDFNNLSKNVNYVNNFNDAKTVLGTTANPVKDFAPGDTSLPNFNDFKASQTNFGMLMDENLAQLLGVSESNVVADDGTNRQYFYYKYTDIPNSAKKMMWADTYMGAIRPNSLPNNFTPHLYTNGTLNFRGMIISRFGDINADAGIRAADGSRVNQLGYVNQILDFDSNILGNSAPCFSMTGQNYGASSSTLCWNVLSYVDKGSLNWNNH